MRKTATKKEDRSGIRAVLIAVAALLALTFLALLIYIYSSSEGIKAQNAEYLEGNTKQVAENIDTALSEGYRNIGVLTKMLELSLDSPEVDVAKLQSLLDNSVYDFMEFADAEGNDHNTTGGISDARDRKYYLDAMKGNSGMEIIFNSRATHETLLMFYSPVYYEGEVTGSLIGVYQAANRITRYLTVSYFGQQATTYLCTPEGRVVASNFGIDTSAELYASDVALECGADPEPIEKALETGETCIFDTDTDASGCVMKLKENGWYLIQLFPPEVHRQMVNASNDRAMLLVLSMMLFFLIAALVVVAFSRRKAKQLDAQQKVLDQYNNIINALAQDYSSVYEVNLQTAELIVYKMSGRIAGMFGDSFTKTDYLSACNSYVNSAVAPEEREEMRDALSIPYIKKHLEGVTLFTKTYLNNNSEYTEMKVVRIGDSDKVVMGFGVKDEEIRREKEREEALEIALEDAKTATKSKSTFLFNMSHDIRTPMNAIIGYTALAKKHMDDPERVDDYLGKIEVSGQHLLTLVNQVLDMSRIESGRVTLEKTTVDIVERTQATMTIIGAGAQEKGISVSSDVGNVEHRYVLADAPRLNQIVLNVLGNALKYTPEGGSVKYTIEEKHSRREGWGVYVLTFADTGIGMSEEFLAHVFESFSREKSTTQSGVEGTGLGMSIVKSIVDLMGGRIDIQSEKGKGTTVTICLELEIDENAGKAQQSIEKTSSMSLSGRRLLLVEDNEMNREIATEILEENGFAVETAEDGDVAVKRISEAEPGYYDAILMDVQMPRMNGYEATKEIRALPVKGVGELPIIAMTANAFEEDRRDAIEAGMNDHLTKPIDVSKLMTVLTAYIK